MVSRWERGVETPRVDTLARLLQECGFEADLVFRRHDDQDRSLIAWHLDELDPERRISYLESLGRFVTEVWRENEIAPLDV